ncbi:hypothetical protein HELRODRAFT_190218 [Helobdella robusta]|uniref:Poly [ADP-ribose] polymerase n=1 Tax=Helobdella robusta TaxID=6412 RepID=T1FRS2_HELRO|nr:hypothetical protein HELRODRAFT_190218 [Helobdella robusta]ESO10884.1 hypothetical protein HELRODRAFT_190218 [Helobdella robusta]
MGVFSGCTISLDFSNSTKVKEKNELRQLVTDAGGVLSFILNKQCKFLATNDAEKTKNSSKCQMAIKLDIAVVSTAYLYECVSAGALLDVARYKIIPSASELSFERGIISDGKMTKPGSTLSMLTASQSVNLKVWRATDARKPQFDEDDYHVVDYAVFLSSVKRVKQLKKILYEVLELHASEVPSSNKFYHFRIVSCTGQLNAENETLDSIDKLEYRYTDDSCTAMTTFSKLFDVISANSEMKPTSNPGKYACSVKLEEACLLRSKAMCMTINRPEDGNLVEQVWQESVGSLDNLLDCPLSTIKTKVDKVEAILVQIKQKLSGNSTKPSSSSSSSLLYANDNSKSLGQLLDEFYDLVPHKAAHQKMDVDSKWLASKFDLCQLIRDMLNLSETTGFSDKCPTITKYRSLKCSINLLDESESEYSDVINFINQSKLQQDGYPDISIKKIFSIHKPFEASLFQENTRKNFDKNDNTVRLFHCSRPENVVGILSRGLLLPKVLDERIGGPLNEVRRLGGGIYFAESASVSSLYSMKSDHTSSRYMFICEVNLGLEQEVTKECPELTSPPHGYHSVHALSSRKDPLSVFKDDEYVIYSTNQQMLKYLVEFNWSTDGVKCNEDLYPCVPLVGSELNAGVHEVSLKLMDLASDDVAKMADPLTKVKAGLLTSSGEESVPMKSVDVFVKMVDLVAEVVILQEYFEAKKAVKGVKTMPGEPTFTEVKYVLPLDDMATVCGFEAFINDKHIIAEVKEKEKARKEYKEAVSKGHGAYLMDQDEQVPDLFTISIGNLPDDCNAVIKITYVTELSVDAHGNICFKLPGCVAPWKQDDMMGDLTQRATRTDWVHSGDVTKTNLQVMVEMPSEIRSITSPTHVIRVKVETATKAVVETAPNVRLNRGFELVVALAQIHVPRMWVEQHPDQQDSRACMLTFYPEFESTSLDKYEIVFIVDQSQSMAHSKAFETARMVLMMFLKRLPDNCLFNIILYGTDFSRLFVASKHVNESTLKEARGFLEKSTSLLGNTDLFPILKKYLILSSPSLTRNLLLISDGYLDSEAEVFRIVKQFPDTTRLFSVGVGTTANNYCLKNLARVGHGTYEYFDDLFKFKWQAKVNSHLEKFIQPALSDISIEWQNFNDVVDIVQAPAMFSALFNNSRLVVYGFAPDCTMAKLRAKVKGREISTIVSTSELSITTGHVIHRLAARSIIQDWSCGTLSMNQLEDEVIKRLRMKYIINLSIQHSIITQYTSFIAVEERKENEQFHTIDKGKIVKDCVVDQLPYMDWRPTICRVKLLTHDGQSTYADIKESSTLKDLISMIPTIITSSSTDNFVLWTLTDAIFLNVADMEMNVWDLYGSLVDGVLCLPTSINITDEKSILSNADFRKEQVRLLLSSIDTISRGVFEKIFDHIPMKLETLHKSTEACLEGGQHEAVGFAYVDDDFSFRNLSKNVELQDDEDMPLHESEEENETGFISPLIITNGPFQQTHAPPPLSYAPHPSLHAPPHLLFGQPPSLAPLLPSQKALALQKVFHQVKLQKDSASEPSSLKLKFPPHPLATPAPPQPPPPPQQAAALTGRSMPTYSEMSAISSDQSTVAASFLESLPDSSSLRFRTAKNALVEETKLRRKQALPLKSDLPLPPSPLPRNSLLTNLLESACAKEFELSPPVMLGRKKTTVESSCFVASKSLRLLEPEQLQLQQQQQQQQKQQLQQLIQRQTVHEYRPFEKKPKDDHRFRRPKSDDKRIFNEIFLRKAVYNDYDYEDDGDGNSRADIVESCCSSKAPDLSRSSSSRSSSFKVCVADAAFKDGGWRSFYGKRKKYKLKRNIAADIASEKDESSCDDSLSSMVDMFEEGQLENQLEEDDGDEEDRATINNVKTFVKELDKLLALAIEDGQEVAYWEPNEEVESLLRCKVKVDIGDICKNFPGVYGADDFQRINRFYVLHLAVCHAIRTMKRLQLNFSKLASYIWDYLPYKKAVLICKLVYYFMTIRKMYPKIADGWSNDFGDEDMNKFSG